MTDDYNAQNTPKSALDARMSRMRTAPRLYDYCFYSARNNLRVLSGLLVSSSESRTIVDIGCGEKPFSKLFGRECNYVGFDWKGSRSPDVICDVTAGLPAKTGTADIVILSECLEHFPNPVFVLEEACRVARQGGSIFISTPFSFPIHGRPHDFYRFTEYFYSYHAEKLGLSIERLEYSNTAVVTPFLDFQNIFMPTPFIPFMLKQIVFAVMNIAVFVPEWVVRRIAAAKPDSRVAKFISSSPVGYALVMTKKQFAAKAGS